MVVVLPFGRLLGRLYFCKGHVDGVEYSLIF